MFINSHVYFKRGYDYYNMGDFKNAIESYNEAIKLNPNDAAAFLGFLCFLQA